MVMKEGYKWKPAGEIPGLFGTAPPAPGAIPVAAVSPGVPCWYYALDGQPLGPCSIEQIHSLVKSGELSLDDNIWREGMAEWLPIEKVPEFKKKR
jgi:hypothetical protein